MHRQRLPSIPPSPSEWKYLFGEEHHTPAVSGERIADKDCRAIGSAYMHTAAAKLRAVEKKEEKEKRMADAEPEGRLSRLLVSLPVN